MCRRAEGLRGFGVVEWVAAMGVALLIVALVAHVVVVQYGQAAVRRAVDEGARAGSAFEAGLRECHERAEEVLRGANGLLRGELGNGISIECTVESDPAQVVVVGRGQLGLRLPLLRFSAIEVVGRAVLEEVP